MKLRRLSFLLPALSALFGVTLTSPRASAQYIGPTPYLSFADSPFAGTVFSSFYREDFEDGFLNTPGVLASSGIVLGPGVNTDSVDADDGALDGFGATGHSYYLSTESSLTFSFNPVVPGDYPTHAGIVWTDVGGSALAPGVAPVSFEALDRHGASLGVIGPFLLGDGSVQGGTAEDRFFGILHADGISAITITTAGSLDWEVDHLQYGLAAEAQAVPEPGLLSFLVSPLAPAWWRVRSRQRRSGFQSGAP